MAIYEFVDVGPGDQATSNGVTDLGGINKNDVIVWSGLNNAGRHRGFRWEAGQLTELQPLPGYANCHAYDINDAGVSVGSSFDGPVATTACKWSNTGQVSALSPNVVCAAHGINNSAVVSGSHEAINSAGTTDWDPAYWDATGAHLLPGATGSYESANAANKTGLIVGESQARATAWSNGLRTVLDANLSRCRAVNDAGVIVGSRARQGVVYQFPYLWVWGSNLRFELPFPATITSGVAKDINNFGLIVGSITASGSERAVSWHGPTVVDLTSLAPAGSGWHLTEAQSVNQTGSITGYGYRNGELRRWLLRPPQIEAKNIKIPPATWHHIVGTWSDGPGIEIGPRGVRKVPPWRPDFSGIPPAIAEVLKPLVTRKPR